MEEHIMPLSDTVELMLSSDYKQRFRGEYHQLKNRIYGLTKMLDAYASGTLPVKPTCSYNILRSQLAMMKTYMGLLEQRAGIEGIVLNQF